MHAIVAKDLQRCGLKRSGHKAVTALERASLDPVEYVFIHSTPYVMPLHKWHIHLTHLALFRCTDILQGSGLDARITDS